MPKSFGYLNQGNPLTIRDNEAQEMVNCAIERGWIEYKDYPVPTDIYECVPNRQVKLPNGTVLRIKNTAGDYVWGGEVKIYNKQNDSYSQFGVKIPIGSSVFSHYDFVQPTKATNTSQKIYGYYCICTATATVVDGQTTYNLTWPTDDVDSGSHTYNSDFIEYSTVKGVFINNNFIPRSFYTILDSGNGYPVIVLSEELNQIHAGDIITVKWYYAFHNTIQGNGELIVKETQQIFYAATIEETDSSSPNKGYESAPQIISNFVVVYEPTYDTDNYIGMSIPRLSIQIPSDTGAVTPQVNIYRMPFGGSEYLFDFSTTTNVTNRLDSVSDSNLGKILETEGNSEQYLYYGNPVVSMMIHNDRLFLAENKLLVFSKPSQFNEFPAENFYAFSEEVIDLCKYDSNLAVFTKTKSYIIYGAGTDGFVIAEIDWKTLNHIRNCAQSIYTKLVSLVSDEVVTVQGEEFPSTKRRVVVFNHRYAQDISLRVKDSLNKGVAVLKVNEDLANRNTSLENRYYVAELRYYESANAQVKTFNLVYDVLADGFCIYDPTVKDFNNQVVFKYRTKEFKMVTPPTHQAQYHKGIYVKGKGTFKVNVYADGELLTSLTHTETDNSKPLRIILHNMGNKRGSTISLEFIGTQGAQIHDWEVYD